jgi:hypothetical protein
MTLCILNLHPQEKRIKKKMTQLTGEVVFAGDPQYPEARQDLIKLYQSYPYVIVFVKQTQDVCNAIAWSREHDVTLRIRSGRCSTEGWSNINNGIVLDVSRLKNIEMDTKSRVVRVGSGVTQGELTNALSKTGFYTALGNEGILGLVGVILGGGIGLLSRLKGPGCDSLVEATMVLANGSVVTCNTSRNRDLFWASRGGGGGNFGVVTSLTMRLYVAPKVVVVWEALFPLTEFFAAYDTWQTWAPFVKDTRLSSNCSVFNNRVDIKGIFFGSKEELGNLLAPIKSVPNGTITETEKPFSEWFVSNPGVEQPFQKYSPMWIFRPFPPKALQIIYDRMLVAPSDQSNFFSLAWGGHTHQVPEGGTAFPFSHRKAIFYSEFGAEWADPKIDADAFSWVETSRLQLSPFFHGGYVNVLDRSISQYGEQYYGENYERLQRIKKQCDPENVFHFEQGVPLCTDNKHEKEKGKEMCRDVLSTTFPSFPWSCQQVFGCLEPRKTRVISPDQP